MTSARVNFVPLGGRILIRAIEAEEITPGGIYLPDQAREKPMQGVVVAVGRGSRDAQGAVHPPEAQVGDRVYYGRYGGTQLKLEGQELLVIREDEVLGLVRPLA